MDGNLRELPGYLKHTDSIVNQITDVSEDFITLLEGPWNKFYNSATLKIWKDEKLFIISKYPFTEINTYPELKDVTTFFSVQDSGNIDKFYIFQNNKITLLISGNFTYPNLPNSIYSKSVALAVSPQRYPYDKYEVYYYCGEDSCINAVPLKDFKAKIYYKNIAKEIAVEIETPQAEKYKLEVFDLLGRKVTTTNFVSLYGKFTFLFPTEPILPGIYIVRLQNISNPEQHLTQKIFIPN
jgi:hypothetical protein